MLVQFATTIVDQFAEAWKDISTVGGPLFRGLDKGFNELSTTLDRLLGTSDGKHGGVYGLHYALDALAIYVAGKWATRLLAMLGLRGIGGAALGALGGISAPGVAAGAAAAGAYGLVKPQPLNEGEDEAYRQAHPGWTPGQPKDPAWKRSEGAPPLSPGTNDATAPSKNPLPGHSTASAAGVDPRLVSILDEAATHLPAGYSAKIQSGRRAGDRGFHGRGLAEDIMIIGPDGKEIPNYQSGSSFRLYEKFAHAAKGIQHEKYPELDPKFAWGGYFGGPKGKYGAMDLMHFDLGGRRGAGGSFEHGLTEQQKRRIPGAESHGMHSPEATLRKSDRTSFLAGAHAMLAMVQSHSQHLAMLTNAKPLGSDGRKNWQRHEGVRNQDIRVQIASTDARSAADEISRQLGALQNRTMRDWRKVG